MGKINLSWNSLSGRMVITFVTYLVVVVALFTILPVYLARTAFDRSLSLAAEDRFAQIASPAASLLSGGSGAGLKELLSASAKGEVVYLGVVDGKGSVVAHTDSSAEGRAFEGAVPAGEGRRTRKLSFRGEDVLEVALPLSTGGKGVGTLLVGLRYGQAKGVLADLLAWQAIAGIAVILLSGLCIHPYLNRILGGLNDLLQVSRAVAAGDLRATAPTDGFDEFRELADSFNLMGRSLREVLSQIQEAGGRLGDMSRTLSTVVQEQATGAAQQAASVSEVTATMEELSRTSHQIAGSAESVKSAAEQTVEMAQQGAVLVREGVDAMDQVRDRVGDISRKTLFMGEKFREIGKVMDIIKEIAGEIHLLALNAAIESAAAGEHGRRFAVVASEVRRLAEKTRESTESIRSLVKEIQAATEDSVRATEAGRSDVERWKETIRLSADAFGEIIQMIEKTSEAASQISLATHQQTSANDQVVGGMRQIAEMVRSTAGSMKESSNSVAELRTVADRLGAQASVFRV
jgi:methyl-accepting chemotaxis protein